MGIINSIKSHNNGAGATSYFRNDMEGQLDTPVLDTKDAM
jgi:hypothetical protein